MPGHPARTRHRRLPARASDLSVEQAALLLGVSRAYAYQLTRMGHLDAITLGERRIRVKSASLLRVLGED